MEAQSQELGSSYDQALVDMVAVDSAVANKNAEIAAEGQQRDEIQASIEVQRQQLAAAQSQLEERTGILQKRLLSTYKSDNTGFIEVMVDSDDFSEFLTKVDMVNAIAEEDRRLIESIRATKLSLEEQIASLQEKEAELAGLLDELNASQQELLAAQAEQQATVASIESQHELTDSQITQIQSEAASIEASMSSIQSEAAAASGGGGTDSPPPAGGSSFTVNSTAYCLGGRTATGMPVGRGIIAVDPGVIPLGSRVHVSGYGDAIAADTGGAISGNMIDVWLPCGEAYAWGTRTVTVTIY